MNLLNWFHEHSLSLALAGVVLGFLIITFVSSSHKWKMWGMEQQAVWISFAGDTYGALAIVMLSKYFRERGSAESKEPHES